MLVNGQRAAAWFMWPVFVLCFLIALCGLGYTIYRGAFIGALFTTVWLVAFWYLSTPTRRAWQKHRSG